MTKKSFLCFLLSFLLLLFLPVSGYLNSKQSVVYAYENVAMDSMGKYLFPIVGLFMYQIAESNGTAEGSKVNYIANTIDVLKENKEAVWNSLSVEVKARIAKYYTNLSNLDINMMLGTSFSDTQLGKYETEMINLQTKIANNETLTSSELQGLGVYKILANYLSKQTLSDYNVSYGNIAITEYNGTQYLSYSYGVNTALSPLMTFDNSDFIRLVSTGYHYKMIDGAFINTPAFSQFTPNYDVVLNLFNNYYLTIASNYPPFRNRDLTKIVILGDASDLYFRIFNSSGQKIKEIITDDLLTVLNLISPYTSTDIKNSDYYINHQNYSLTGLFNLNKLGYVDYTPSSTLQGQYSLSDIISTTIDPSAVWEDVSSTAAERVIANEASTTSDTNIEVNEDDDRTTIIVTPSTGVSESSGTDTGVGESPDTGGVIGDGILKIPILGSIWQLLKNILDWLKGLLESFKTLLLSLFIPSAGYFTNYFNNLKTFIGERLGVLDYPIELLIFFANSYMNIPDSGSIVIDVPALNVNILGTMYTLFPAYTFDFNSIFGMTAFGQLRSAYLVVVDVIVALGLVYLLSKKASEVFRK